MANRKKTLREIRQQAEIDSLKKDLETAIEDNRRLLSNCRENIQKISELEDKIKYLGEIVAELSAFKKLTVLAMDSLNR